VLPIKMHVLLCVTNKDARSAVCYQ